MNSTTTQQPLLEVQGLQTYFHVDGAEYRAVDGVNFTVHAGRTLAIVGESGCGKSVTSYSIMRLIQKPGSIVGGRILFTPPGKPTVDIAALSEKDDLLYDLRGGAISMIFQEPMTALSPVHTIGNQVCEAILLHQNVSKQEAEQKAINMLGRVGIPGPERRIKQYPHELSGGMRQRVVIAMALVCNPQLLIADEPTTALDVTIQAQVLRLMKELQTELGTAILLITHDLGVVAQAADDVAVMYLGRVVEHGPVRDVLKNPQHPYTQALLRSLPSLHKAQESLPSIDGSVPMLNAIPTGCPFHPRCSQFQAGTCDRGNPPSLQSCAHGGRAACSLLEEAS